MLFANFENPLFYYFTQLRKNGRVTFLKEHLIYMYIEETLIIAVYNQIRQKKQKKINISRCTVFCFNLSPIITPTEEKQTTKLSLMVSLK